MAFGLETFKRSRLGRRVGAILEDEQSVAEMIVFSRHQMPAVQAVGKALLALGPEIHDDYVKTTIGRWVKEILAKQGWEPCKSARVSPGNLFSRGMIYNEATRFVTPPQRGKTIDQPLQDALSEIDCNDDDPLYRAALAVEQDEELATEMAEWEEATLADGLPDDRSKKKP